MEPQEAFSITSDRITFTPLQIDNIYTHFRWNNDPELNRLDSEVPYEEESFHAFKQRFEQMCARSAPHHRDFEIHLNGGALIGVAYVTDISKHNQHGLVGVTIGDRERWGQGYGRESLELLLRYCFEELGLHRVGAETFEYNAAWKRLVQEAGFEKEGTARDYLRRDGTYWDKETYSLLEREYRRRDVDMAAAA